MAIRGSKVTVTTVSGAVASTTVSGVVSDPVPMLVKNSPGNTGSVFLGGVNVSATGGSTGYELEPGQGVALQLINTEILYAVAATGSIAVDVLLGRQNI